MTLADIIRRHSQPLEPLATNVEFRADPLPGIQAVLFDVYGTLLISASGDIDHSAGVRHGEAAAEALAAVNLQLTVDGDEVVEALRQQIKRHHAAATHPHPEVEIREVWTDALRGLAAERRVSGQLEEADVAQLAIEYEVRVNPVWMMPGLTESLAAIHRAGLAMGIISNAQFFTLELFPALVGRTTDELGFDPDLCFWSFQHRQAKPGVYLYQRAAAALADRGISPGEVLYVGNDMRNDVAPAAEVGFRTVLFAGDKRSLRLREDDPRTRDLIPDAVVCDLSQILTVLQLAKR